MPAPPEIGTSRGGERKFTGHPVSLDFQGADLRAVLRTFSEISGLNIVIDPAVQGTVDVALRDVPWDQALDIILAANKLGYIIDGTIVRIAPLNVLADEQSQRRKVNEEQALAGELRVLTQRLSYAKAEELQALLTKSALSQRGTVQVDPRTNTLIITDLADRLTTASELIAKLDLAQPQVEIEARIVQTNKNYARALGVQWGFNGAVSPALGNTTQPRVSELRLVVGQHAGGRHRWSAHGRQSRRARRAERREPGARIDEWRLQPRCGALGAGEQRQRPAAVHAAGHHAEQHRRGNDAGRPDPDPDGVEQHRDGHVPRRRADAEA